MSVLFASIAYALYLYSLIVIARVLVEITRQFARSWRPAGFAAVGLEFVFVATDPPLKALRRMIPPLRLGSIAIDVSAMLLLLTILALRWAAVTLA